MSRGVDDVEVLRLRLWLVGWLSTASEDGVAVSVSSLERSGVPIERGVDAAEVIVVIVVDVVERMEFIISVWFCSKAAVCCRVTA
jgi:hypothetical protein